MSLVNSDGSSLFVGDGAVSESFAVLRGVEMLRLEIKQRLIDSDAIDTNGWQAGVSASQRRIIIEATCIANDEPQALRLRSLALNGVVGNFRLNLNAADDVHFSAYVTQFDEIIQAGTIKRHQFRLESTAAATIV